MYWLNPHTEFWNCFFRQIEIDDDEDDEGKTADVLAEPPLHPEGLRQDLSCKNFNEELSI